MKITLYKNSVMVLIYILKNSVSVCIYMRTYTRAQIVLKRRVSEKLIFQQLIVLQNKSV